MLAPEHRAGPPGAMLTFGPSGGLLPGRRLSEGNVVGLTILITFPDTPSTVTPADVDALLNAANYKANGNFCSVNGYFQTISTGRLNFTNLVVGPFPMSRPRMFYSTKEAEGKLVPEAIDLALNSGVDLHQFDSLGAGIVDSLCIMYAGQTVYQGDLWPHNWTHRKKVGDMRTDLYIVTSMGRNAADLSIGTFCHESGHLLCRFPDLYDYGDAQREGDAVKSSGLGYYCIMSGGNHLDRGRTPSPVISYLRDLVGWCATEVDLNNAGSFSAVHGDYNTVMKYQTTLPNEYYIVENRSQIDLDRGLPSNGLAIYHCDTRGSNEFQQGSLTKHYQSALLQADGHLDLENGLNQGDGGDLFSLVAGTAVSHATNPATRMWNGADSGLVVSGVSEPGATITFRVGTIAVAPAPVSGSSSPAKRIPDNQATGISDVITIAGPGTIQSIRVKVRVTHPYVGDLKIELQSPTGRRCLLHNRTGGDGDNLALDLTSAPPSPLSPLTGQSYSGAWVMRVADLDRRDVGTLDSWSIEVQPGA